MDGTSSYVDYSAFTTNNFSATAYANTLVLQTNDPNDTPLDLATPLSKVLFDIQEVDTNIDNLTTQNALPIIERTSERAAASQRILDEVEGLVTSLNESYRRLEQEVAARHESAEQVRLAADRMLRTLRLGREVQRVVQLGRQLEGQATSVAQGEHGIMLPAARSLLALTQLFVSANGVKGGSDLSKVNVVATLRSEFIVPAERALISKAQQTIREFSMSSLLASGPQSTSTQAQPTHARTEETKSRATSALQTLYLLSPTKATKGTPSSEPTLLLSALQSYLQTALTSSVASLARALSTLPQLDRTLLEISARCQNIVALEALLQTIKPPAPTPSESASQVDDDNDPGNLLTPLLRHLDTPSLPSYFWRSMAGQMTSRVQEILNRGGVSARTLRTNRDRVREAIRECVSRGSQLPVASVSLGGKEAKLGNWEREAAVMVQSVVGPLQR